MPDVLGQLDIFFHFPDIEREVGRPAVTNTRPHSVRFGTETRIS